MPCREASNRRNEDYDAACCLPRLVALFVMGTPAASCLRFGRGPKHALLAASASAGAEIRPCWSLCRVTASK